MVREKRLGAEASFESRSFRMLGTLYERRTKGMYLVHGELCGFRSNGPEREIFILPIGRKAALLGVI